MKRLEIFGSAATDAFRAESSDFDFLVDFGNRSLGPWAGSFFNSQMPSKRSSVDMLIS